MGQDRELTDEQKEFALTTVERFIEIWEAEERSALQADRDRKLEALEVDAETAAQNDALMAQDIANEVEEYEFKKGAADAIYFDKKFPEPVEEGQEPPQPPHTERVDEELSQIENKYKTLKVMASKFLKNDDWSAMIKNLL